MILHGNCLDVLPTLAADSVDAIAEARIRAMQPGLSLEIPA